MEILNGRIQKNRAAVNSNTELVTLLHDADSFLSNKDQHSCSRNYPPLQNTSFHYFVHVGLYREPILSISWSIQI